MGVAERGPFTGHQEVALQRQLEPTGHRHPVDGPDDRLGGGGPWSPGRVGTDGVGRRRGEVGTGAAEFFEVESRRKGGTRAGENDDVDFVVRIGGRHLRSEPSKELARQGISLLRSIEREGGDATGDLDEQAHRSIMIGVHVAAANSRKNRGVAQSSAKRNKRRHRQAGRIVATTSARPARFEHQGGHSRSRRTLFIAILIVLAAALVLPTIVGLNLVGRSVPPITQQPGGARLVNDNTPDTRVITRPPQ